MLVLWENQSSIPIPTLCILYKHARNQKTTEKIQTFIMQHTCFERTSCWIFLLCFQLSLEIHGNWHLSSIVGVLLVQQHPFKHTVTQICPKLSGYQKERCKSDTTKPWIWVRISQQMHCISIENWRKLECYTLGSNLPPCDDSRWQQTPVMIHTWWSR